MTEREREREVRREENLVCQKSIITILPGFTSKNISKNK